jgi:hypothetical protein
MDTIQSQMNPVKTLKTYLFKIHFNIILSSTACLQSGLLASVLSKIYMHLSHVSYTHKNVMSKSDQLLVPLNIQSASAWKQNAINLCYGTE